MSFVDHVDRPIYMARARVTLIKSMGPGLAYVCAQSLPTLKVPFIHFIHFTSPSIRHKG